MPERGYAFLKSSAVGSSPICVVKQMNIYATFIRNDILFIRAFLCVVPLGLHGRRIQMVVLIVVLIQIQFIVYLLKRLFDKIERGTCSYQELQMVFV